MDSELNLLIKNIKEKTGIDVVIFSEGMKYFATTSTNKEIYAPTDKDFDGVYQDILTGNTYFRLKYKNTPLIGYVRGVSQSEKNYAYLLSDLIESASSKELQLSQQEYLKSILLGECNRTQIQKYEKKYSTPNKTCFVLVVSANGQRNQDVLNVLSNYDTSGGNFAVFIEDGNYAYLKFSDSATDDYQSSTDFAEYNGGIWSISPFKVGITDKISLISTTLSHSFITTPLSSSVSVSLPNTNSV